MVTSEAAAKGVVTNRRDAFLYAREIYQQILLLGAEEFSTYTAIALELERRGFRGRRGGRITPERLYEIRERLRTAK